MKESLISIIMPTYNRENKISEPIISIINQTYQNWELLIIDDKSTDGTSELINKFIHEDGRIKYFYNDGKKGVPSARNLGINHANGEYIAFLDSDDKWIDHHLKNSILILENSGENVCFSLWYEIVGNMKMPIDKVEAKIFNEAFIKYEKNTRNNVVYFTNVDFYRNLLLEDFYCYHINTMVFRKSILEPILMFDENMKSNDDIDFTFRIIMKYGFCLIKDYHYEYYQGDDCIYAFINRRDIDMKILIDNKQTVNKITYHGLYKIMHLKKRKKYVQSSSIIKDKKEWNSYLNSRISKKLFTIGFLNIRQIKGLYYMMKSMFYSFKLDKLKLILRTKFTGKNILPDNTYFDIY